MYRIKKWCLLIMTCIISIILVPIIVACNSNKNKEQVFNIQILDEKLYKNKDEWVLNLNPSNLATFHLTVEINPVNDSSKIITSSKTTISNNLYRVVFSKLDPSQKYQIKSIRINNKPITLTAQIKQLKLKPHAVSVNFKTI